MSEVSSRSYVQKPNGRKMLDKNYRGEFHTAGINGANMLNGGK
jgi:hypothetical protein